MKLVFGNGAPDEDRPLFSQLRGVRREGRRPTIYLSANEVCDLMRDERGESYLHRVLLPAQPKEAQ